MAGTILNLGGGGKLVFKELGVINHSWGDATSVSFVLTQDMLPGANLDKLTDENFFIQISQTLGANWSGYNWLNGNKQATYNSTTLLAPGRKGQCWPGEKGQNQPDRKGQTHRCPIVVTYSNGVQCLRLRA